jgi:hypothetical protein
LRIGTGTEHARGTLLQDFGDLVDDGSNKRSKETENKGSQRLTNVLEEFLEAGDLFDSSANGLDDPITELQNGVNPLSSLDWVEIRAQARNDVGVSFRTRAHFVFLFLGI